MRISNYRYSRFNMRLRKIITKCKKKQNVQNNCDPLDIGVLEGGACYIGRIRYP